MCVCVCVCVCGLTTHELNVGREQHNLVGRRTAEQFHCLHEASREGREGKEGREGERERKGEGEEGR